MYMNTTFFHHKRSIGSGFMPTYQYYISPEIIFELDDNIFTNQRFEERIKQLQKIKYLGLHFKQISMDDIIYQKQLYLWTLFPK